MSDQSIIESRRIHAIKKVADSYFETLLRNGDYESFMKDFPQEMEELKILKDMCQNKDPDLQDFTHVWLTITPEEQNGYDADPVALATFIKSWLDKSTMVEQYTFAMEQRSDTRKGMGKGCHAHILIRRQDNRTFAEYNQNIKRKFGAMHGTKFKFFGANKTGSTYYKGQEFAKNKLKYLAGVKEGKHKQSLAEIDIVWREWWGLQPIYKHCD